MNENSQQQNKKKTQQESVIIKKQDIGKGIKFPQSMIIHKNSCIKIADGDWIANNINDYCKYIQKWNVKDMLFIGKNNYAQILMDIKDINFPYLSQLYLSGNLLQSIQCLIGLNAPLLQVIWIHDNLLTSIKPLRKCNFANLAYLRFTQNMICDCGQLSDLQINFPASLYLDYNKFGKVQFQDLTPLAKFKYTTYQFYGIYGFSSQRIYQKKLTQCLKKIITTQINFGFHYLFLH